MLFSLGYFSLQLFVRDGDDSMLLKKTDEKEMAANKGDFAELKIKLRNPEERNQYN